MYVMWNEGVFIYAADWKVEFNPLSLERHVFNYKVGNRKIRTSLALATYTFLCLSRFFVQCTDDENIRL